MWCDSRGCVIFKDMLDSPGGDILSLLTDKNRADNPVSNKFPDIRKGVIINENRPYLITLPPDLYGMLVKIDVFYVHAAEL